MYLKYKYWVFKKAIPIKTCQKILKAGRQKILKQATTFKGLDKTKRDCKISWINEQWIYDILNPFIHTANRNAGWNFDWDWNDSPQFTIYEKGHYYNWHIDQSASLRNGNNKNFKGKTRKLSLTLQLTDQSEYTGGDFQFKWIQDDKQDQLNIVTVDDAKEIGTVIVFPSFIHHRVLPLIKGKRESLVNWSLGKPFK